MIELKSKNKLKSQFEGEKIIFIERTCGDKRFTGLSPFYVKKVVDNVAGGSVITARQTRDGKIVVHTTSRKQAENFMKLSKIDQFNVIVSEDEKASQSTGVIYCRDLKYSSDEEILDELKEQKVIGIKRAKKRGENGDLFETGLYFVTFDVRQTPSEIKVGYENLEVRPFIPEPLRCFVCLKFGHGQKFCRTPDEKKCGNCAEKIHTDRGKGEKCHKEPRCVNCGSRDHGSFAKSCNIYKMEQEISAIRVNKKIPYGSAKREYMISHPLRQRSFATAVRTKPPDIGLVTVAIPGASGNPTPASMDRTKMKEQTKKSTADTDQTMDLTSSECEMNSTNIKRGPSSPIEIETLKKLKSEKQGQKNKVRHLSK